MSVWKLILYSLMNILNMYMVFVLMQAIMGKFKVLVLSIKESILFVIVLMGINILTILIKFYQVLPFNYILINQFVIFFMIYFFIKVKFQTTWYLPFIHYSLYWITMVVMEYPYALILTKYFSDVSFLEYWIQFIGATYFTIGYTLLTIVFRHYNKRYNFTFQIPKSIGTYLVVSPLVLIVLYTLMYSLIGIDVFINQFLIYILSALIVTLLVYVWFYQQKNKNHVDELENRVEEFKNYATTIDQLYSEIRHYKHDMNNLLLGMRNLIDTKNIQGVEAYYKEIVSSAPTNSETYNFMSMINDIDSLPVKGLLLSKFEVMRSKHINIKFDDIQDINNLVLSDVDICRVLGIIIDNAIEAAEFAEVSEILMAFDNHDDCKSIKVMNTYKELPDPSRIFNMNYTTKGVGRGIGLNSLKHILQGYEKVSLEQSIEANYFITKLQFEA